LLLIFEIIRSAVSEIFLESNAAHADIRE